jgi:hypothetical protein
MSDLIAPSFLFRFSVPCRYRDPLWTAEAVALHEAFRLPNLSELDGGPRHVDLRVAWSEKGLALTAAISGKRQPPWCRAGRLEDSDGLHLWIDTRDTHNVHRATRFCHRFVLLPAGGGARGDQPLAEPLLIHRAREQPRPVRPTLLGVRSEKRPDGYLLHGLIAAEALTGFDPAEHPRLGFFHALMDRELGEIPMCGLTGMPYQEDPSLWASLQLERPARSAP